MKSFGSTAAASLLSCALICAAPAVQAQGPIEGGLKSIEDWFAKQLAKPGSLAAAVIQVKTSPKKYRVRIHDMAKGDVYCELQSVNIDSSTGWLTLDVDYRGGTRVRLTPVSDDSLAMRGAYKISLPLMGDSEVQVFLVFNGDGSARGEWKNMGFSGAFDIAKM